MGKAEELYHVDVVRREAMISGDVSALGRILSDELVWTHSSGKTEDKNAMLHAIDSKTVCYQTLTIEEYSISQHGELFIYHGILNGSANREGVEKNLRSKFLSVWRLSGSLYEMLAWQSTGF